MCESTAYLITPKGEEKIMEYVVHIVPEANGRIFLSDILGEEKTVTGKLKEVRLIDNKVMIEQI
ncbi:CooT family nickel-binding protein [Haloimpatiens sp. FM7330]|uniref:CooT family nickel-binding protein n=1 Tax=Haloimpatiens sp. FM7330 TaxID=3298610 RepID=UPI003628A14C